MTGASVTGASMTSPAWTISADAVSGWVARYGQAWVERDAALAVSLFSENASYSQTPFGPYYVGHEQIARYWTDITAAESDVTYTAGQPLIAGHWAACEWWVTMTEHGELTTLPGCLILNFDRDGRCQELREYWHQEPGHRPPPNRWGIIGS